MTGQLRLADWKVDDTRPLEPVHAYAVAGPQLRSMCGSAYWSVRLARAESPARLCQPCREVVAGAAFRSLEEIAELEGGPAPITRTVPA